MLPVIGLLSFALPHWIECQNHETFQSQVGGESLRLRLSLLRVAGLQENGGIAAGLIGPVNIRGDKEARQALENHFLDGVGLSLDAAGDSWIQRTVVIRQTAQNSEEPFADPLLPPFRVGHGANFAHSALALC